MGDFPDDLLRRHARAAGGSPATSAGSADSGTCAQCGDRLLPARYCLLLATDRLLMMIRRQVADLWRRAATGALATHSDWALLYQELLAKRSARFSRSRQPMECVKIRDHLHSLLTEHRARCRPASRAELVRGRLIDGVRPGAIHC